MVQVTSLTTAQLLELRDLLEQMDEMLPPTPVVQYTDSSDFSTIRFIPHVVTNVPHWMSTHVKEMIRFVDSELADFYQEMATAP